MDRASNRLGAAAVALLLLILTPTAYTGAYLGLVKVSPYGGPEYRLGGEMSEKVFAPAHQVDVKVRKETWEGGQALPSPYYHSVDVQYFSPGPEFKLSRESALMKAYKAGQAAKVEE
jgi:hypothetical protein